MSRVRVLVVGSSVGHYVRPPAADDHEAPVDELLERSLRERGLDAEVRNDSRWFDTVVDGNRRLPHLLTWFRPQVVIVLYGYIESQPLVCPRWFARWLFTSRPRTDRLNRSIRRALSWPASWLFYRSVDRVAALPGLPSRVSPHRVQVEVERLVALAHKERRAVVLCANVPDPSDRIEASLPTTRIRAGATSAAIARAVEASGDRAHLVDLRRLVADSVGEEVLPDGIHLSASGHRLLADHLAELIVQLRSAQ